jgi:hypothetical protein
LDPVVRLGGDLTGNRIERGWPQSLLVNPLSKGIRRDTDRPIETNGGDHLCRKKLIDLCSADSQHVGDFGRPK